MGKEDRYKEYARVLFWLAVFTLIMIIYCVVFGLIISPAGATGVLKSEGIIASFAYTLLWFGLSVLAGYKWYKEIFISAMIYSAFPIIGLTCGTLFIGTPLGIGAMLFFSWSAPIQGMCFGKEGLIKSMVIIQPLLFLLGYFLTAYLRKQKDC
ncbi:hypothetical protein [Ruminiclostridium cellobioparum]|uniref:hypothetical protein n=1 Tax=Ruminiclostridium cellobioparum TaxID=29355 RepID=UPI0028AFB8DE|nr:hypothetical protein [Ruminiclostridium cellobioparum]